MSKLSAEDLGGRTSLAIIVPCFNEGPHIRDCVKRVLAQSLVSEVIVVDDGSTDGSAEILEALALDPKVRLVTHSVNRGKGAVLRTGFALADSDLVIPQDADLEQDPADYELLIEPILDGRADVVYGTRFSDQRRSPGQQLVHFLANRLLTSLSNFTTGLRLTDMETGYKAFRREVLVGLNVEEDRFGVEPELTAKFVRGGWRVCEVPVSYHPRTVHDGKKIGWRDGLRTLYCIFKYAPR